MVFQRALAPVPRRALKAGILGLATGRGDIKALEDELAGLYRLRVGVHRVIFRYAEDGSIVCLFAQRRGVVYELLAASLSDLLAGE
ncbi:MAG: hypothetical protein RLZZ15_3478 [Verrucomicrobiota bacterium]